MALDTVFAAAYIDNDVKYSIFGRRLRPFCLWHLALLQTVESPFVSTGEISLRDLKIAIGICSLHYRHSKVRRPFLPRRLNQARLQKKVDQFMNYVHDYFYKPEYTIKDPDPNPPSYPGLPLSDAPPAVTTAFNAARGAGVPVSQAWNMPIGEAYIAEAMYFKQAGNTLDFMSDEDREMQEDMLAAGLR